MTFQIGVFPLAMWKAKHSGDLYLQVCWCKRNQSLNQSHHKNVSCKWKKSWFTASCSQYWDLSCNQGSENDAAAVFQPTNSWKHFLSSFHSFTECQNAPRRQTYREPLLPINNAFLVTLCPSIRVPYCVPASFSPLKLFLLSKVRAI